MTNKPFIKDYLKETNEILNSLPIKDIAEVVDILFEGWKRNSTVFVMGNGGSSSTASHFAADLAKYPTDGIEGKNAKKRFKVLCLNDNMPLTSAVTNDIGFDSIFSEQLLTWIKKGHIVFAFSVHGGSGETKFGKWSQNIPKAFALARKHHAILLGMAGDTGGIMKQTADACIVVPTVNKQTISPQVEGIDVVIHHLIIHRLRELINQYLNQ